MSKKKLPSSINLLEPVFAPDDIWDKLYFWVFKVGRYVFVGVEIVVLLVFGSRFLFDKRNNDLSKKINLRVDTLQEDFYKKSEVKFINTHLLLEDLDIATKRQVTNSRIVASVLDTVPSNLKLERFAYNEGLVSLTFVATDFASVAAHERTLKENPAHSDISVRLNQSGEASDIDFIVSYKINTEMVLNESR